MESNIYPILFFEKKIYFLRFVFKFEIIFVQKTFFDHLVFN